MCFLNRCFRWSSIPSRSSKIVIYLSFVSKKKKEGANVLENFIQCIGKFRNLSDIKVISYDLMNRGPNENIKEENTLAINIDITFFM